ncbi:MAG TPA: hypothetical protein PLO63_11650 [Syntrophales bacterium]|nr:hypothetical protein [Syntrophales bacterium]
MRNDKLSPAEEIREHGKSAQGRKELIKHLDGNRLTAREAILAKCYDCCGHFVDGKEDCRVTRCPLHPFMPYLESKEKQPKRLLSEEQRRAIGERLLRGRTARRQNAPSEPQRIENYNIPEIFSPQDEGLVMSKEVRAK